MRRSASEIIRNLESRVAKLEKQAITKSEAYEALRDFMAQNRTNTRMIVEIGGYLQVLKDGGDLSDRDLKDIRKMMHRNNASDLADSFRSNPTGRKPTTKVVRQPRVQPAPKVKTLTIKDIIHFLKEEARTATGGGFHSLHMYRGNNTYWEFQMEPGDRQRQDHWHFVMDDYDEEEDNRGDAWNDWEWNWAEPLQDQTVDALTEKFPILAENRHWQVMVGEKGHVDFQFPKDIISED